MKSQNEAILSYLRAGKAITPLEALERFGVFRLAGRILELRQAGYTITTERLQVPGGKVVARYSLRGE